MGFLRDAFAALGFLILFLLFADLAWAAIMGVVDVVCLKFRGR